MLTNMFLVSIDDGSIDRGAFSHSIKRRQPDLGPLGDLVRRTWLTSLHSALNVKTMAEC